jgi:hypothetical protein
VEEGNQARHVVFCIVFVHRVITAAPRIKLRGGQEIRKELNNVSERDLPRRAQVVGGLIAA